MEVVSPSSQFKEQNFEIRLKSRKTPSGGHAPGTREQFLKQRRLMFCPVWFDSFIQKHGTMRKKKSTSPHAPAAVGMLVFLRIQLFRNHSVRNSRTCPGDHSASQTMKRVRQCAESVKFCEHLNQTARKNKIGNTTHARRRSKITARNRFRAVRLNIKRKHVETQIHKICVFQVVIIKTLQNQTPGGSQGVHYIQKTMITCPKICNII